MKYLVFSENNQNGVQLTFDEYVALQRTMTHEDFETHQAVPIAESISDVLEAVLQETAATPQH